MARSLILGLVCRHHRYVFEEKDGNPDKDREAAVISRLQVRAWQTHLIGRLLSKSREPEVTGSVSCKAGHDMLAMRPANHACQRQEGRHHVQTPGSGHSCLLL